MYKLFVFAGTTEGRLLIEFLTQCLAAPAKIHVFTATEYGKEMLSSVNNVAQQVEVCCTTGRLNSEEMAVWMEREKPFCVVDATHPYAQEVSKQIRFACDKTGCPYERLLRPTAEAADKAGATYIYVETVLQAAQYLENKAGSILLTTGSKELQHFATAKLRERVYPRILPTSEGLRQCEALGIPRQNIICMQGPFSQAMNQALLRQVNARFLVTKDSGKIGGFGEKLAAAAAEQVVCVIVGRPVAENGYDFSTLRLRLEETYMLPLKRECEPRSAKTNSGLEKEMNQQQSNNQHQWFPLFRNLTGQKVVIIGGGHIAARRLQTLLRFSASLVVITKEVGEELQQLIENTALWRQCVQLEVRSYEPGDCQGAFFVVAATADRQVNQQIAGECKQLDIPVSVADKREQSTFFFPAIIENETLVMGLTAEGKDHALVRKAAAAIRTYIAGQKRLEEQCAQGKSEGEDERDGTEE